MRVLFTSLGCKLNHAEVEKLTRQFLAAGHTLVERPEDAELHVVNSCTVTHRADRDTRKAVRRGRQLNPALRTVVTGCYPSAESHDAPLPGVDLVVPNPRKEELLELVHAAFPERAAELPDPGRLPWTPIEHGHTRASIKVEDGCNMRCSFCIVPRARGRQRSRPLEEVVAEVRGLSTGYREVVVTGVQISAYEDRGRGLADLVAALLAETKVARLRLTSIAPWQLDPQLLALFSDRRLCRHLHLSLQSGATATLRRMRRPYSAARYAAVLDQIREAIPGVAITTDVIVGFPGETAEEFAQSLAFVERMEFARVHVFPYSPRPGTHAATLPDQVPPEEKKARSSAMLALARESERRFQRQHLGETCDVVWEVRKNGRWNGLSDHYIRVFAESDRDLAGVMAPVRLCELVEGGVFGELQEGGGVSIPSAADGLQDVGVEEFHRSLLVLAVGAGGRDHHHVVLRDDEDVLAHEAHRGEDVLA